MRHLVGLVVVAATAFWLPDPWRAATPALRPAFVVTMLFVGSLITRHQWRALWRHPRRPLVGTGIQYTVMPLTAWGIAQLLPPGPLRVGTILVGCMPGAMASNVVTALVGGDVLLSVAMTTLATLTTPVILATWLPLLASARIAVPIAELVQSATLLVVLPVLAGAGIRWRLERRLPRWWDRLAAGVATAAILLIIGVVVARGRDQLATAGATILAAMVGLNLLAYAAASFAGRLLRWPARARRTLLIEVAMQNAGLGSVLATVHLGPEAALPSVVYTSLCVLTALLVPYWPWAMRPAADPPGRTVA